MNEKLKIWMIGLCIIFFIGVSGIFWTNNLNNISISWEIKMDDNTRDYLVEHDYCIVSQNQHYDSGKPDIMFMGDCQYFNKSLMDLEEK